MKQVAAIVDELEGTWELTVTLRSCQTGEPLDTYRAMSAFLNGGTLLESRAIDSLPLATVGHGLWRHTEGANYAAVIKLFRFNRDGTFAGIERFSHRITLADDGKEFSATASVHILDAEDRLVRTGCATVTALRLQ